MTQYTFDPDLPAGLPGMYVSGKTMPMTNPVLPQITQVETEADNDDGDWTVEVRAADQSELIATITFAALASSAVQIAQGLVDNANLDSAFRGLLNDAGAALKDTDDAEFPFRRGGFAYDVTIIVPAGAALAQVTEIQAAGFTAVGPGDLIESDDSGGFNLWTGDGPAGLGIVLRNSEAINDANNSDTPSTLINGPSQLDVLTDGIAFVQLFAGETVAVGDGPAAYDDATKTWKKNAGGDWVIIEGSQWQSAGTGVQRVKVRMPLES